MKALSLFCGVLALPLLSLTWDKPLPVVWSEAQTQDSIVLLSGSVIDSAWSKYRTTLAAGVVQGRSMDMERYTIQVFSGKRSEATQWYGRLQDSLGNAAVLLHFDEPNFKVSVGLYPIRLAAEHELKIWRRSFPQAFVVRAPDVQVDK